MGRRLSRIARSALSPPPLSLLATFGFFLWERRWFAVAAVVLIVMALMPAPTGLSREAWMALTLAAVAAILLIAEPIPLPAVAMLLIVGQVVLLGRSPDAVAGSLLSDAVLFVLGSLLLSVAVVKRRLDRRLALGALSLAGTRPLGVTAALSATAAVVTIAIGEHAAAAMLMPAAIALIRAASTNAALTRHLSATLLMSIAFSCAIAAIATPSGAARNAMVLEYWRVSGGDTAVTSYAVWVLYCLPVALLQLPAVALILHARYRPNGANLEGARQALSEQLSNEGPMTLGDRTTVAILLATVAGFYLFSGTIGLGAVALLGVAALLALGLVRWLDLNAGVNWGVVLLYAASLSLGAQLIETGAAQWLASWVFAGLAPVGGNEAGAALWAAMATAMAGTASAMSSGNGVALLTPVNLELAAAAGADPTIAGLVSIVASSFAYLTVIGAPACAIVYASGYLRAQDMLAVGLRLFPISMAALMLAALVYWPALG